MNHWLRTVTAKQKNVSSQEEGGGKKGGRGRVQQQECVLCWGKVDTGTKTCLREKEIRKQLDHKANWC